MFRKSTAFAFITIHFFVFAALAADDPLYDKQAALHEARLSEAEKIFYDHDTGIKNDVLIGVIDKGSINNNHPDLVGVVDSRSRASDHQSNETHGQFVTGILAAKAFNDIGIHGAMGAHAKVLFLGVDNSLEIADTIHELAESGAAVINISLGVARKCSTASRGSARNGDCIHPCATNTTIAEAITWAMNKKNTVFVIAAGNDNDFIADLGKISQDGLIVVGAMNNHFSKAKYSNFGPGVTVFAPDFGVTSLTKNGFSTPTPATSFTTPLVTGAAALAAAYLISNHIPYTPADIRQLILQSGESHPMLQDQAEQARSLNYLNLAQALQTFVRARKN